MYFPEFDIYINEKNRILFDIQSQDVYQLDEEYYSNFKRVYEGNPVASFPEIEDFINSRSRTQSTYKKFESNLSTLKLNVSHGCNLRCSYCYAGNGDYGDNGLYMKEDVAQQVSKLIDNYAHSVNSITFFGGEPTLNPKIIKYFCEKYPDFTFMMQTNGTQLLKPRIVELILKYNFKITLSIDGPREIHDINRRDAKRNPTYDLIRKNVEKIMKEDPSKFVSVQATYTSLSKEKYTKREIAQSIYNDFGIKNIRVHDVWDDSPALYKFNLEKVEKQFLEFLNLEEPFFMRSKVADVLSMFFSKDVDWFHFCDAGLGLVSIDPKGDIWPCHLFVKTSEKIGNIKEDKLGSVWDKILKYPAKFHTFNKDNDICSSCIARFRCRMCKRVDVTPFNEERCSSQRLETMKVLDLVADYIDHMDDIVDKLDKVQNVI
ncbi:radical SAM/SPASM domain-containing protein [Caldibacillus thermoamylovorans]|uniref:radical SAM/SPASM domain-containing protein n=1 Tax=Caldibacillus thermoamylovorans TaxID=35841 RepID=UPI00203FF5B1|nr:radical SAM protein [Caldibacillus thermoamylovorans]MCM3478654.1 radical SAM protein [Caldibacillus thermoamylovorans]